MSTQLTTTSTTNGYVVAYGHKNAPVYAPNAFIAKIEGIALLGVPKNHHHLVSALLAQQAKQEDTQFLAYVEHYYAGH